MHFKMFIGSDNEKWRVIIIIMTIYALYSFFFDKQVVEW